MNNENSVPSSLYREEGNDTGEKGSPADSLEDTVEAGQTSSGAEKRDLTDTDTGSEDEFDRLIKDKYARAFASRVQKIIDKRFSKTKILEAKVKEDEELIEKLCLLCEGDSSEPHRLYELLEKKINSPQKNTPLPPTDEKIREMEEQAKRDFPDFDSKECLADSGFRALVDMGLTYSQAYTLTHIHSIRENAAREGARQALLSVSTMGRRPAEGESSLGAAPSKRGVASLTSREMKSLMERAARGETIKFSEI